MARTSQKRIEANRRNAQKSTGPKTPEGKERSRANALTHGMTASTAIYRPIRHENPADFAEMRSGLFADWQPVGAREELAVEMIAAAYKRVQRVEAMEAAFFDGGMEVMQRRHDKPLRPSSDDDLGCGIVIGAKDYKLTWENLDRYRRAAWLDYNRAVNQLRALQKDRLERPKKEHEAWLAEQKYLKQTRVPGIPASAPAPETPEKTDTLKTMASFRPGCSESSPEAGAARLAPASQPQITSRSLTELPKAA